MKSVITKTFMSFLAAVGLFGVSVVSAFAAFDYQTQTVAFNDHPSDCETVQIANHTTQEGVHSPCWSTSISQIDGGEIINVRIYYHHTGYGTAQDVKFKLNQPSGELNAFTFNGTVSGGGASANGSVSIHLASPSTLQFGSVKWYPNQQQSLSALPFGQNGNEIFTSAGLRIGNLAPDSGNYFNQGSVVISFKAVSNDVVNDTAPDIDTLSPQFVGNAEATMRGSYDANGVPTRTWFEYGIGDFDSETSHILRGITAGNFQETLTNLSNGDYQYRACAEHITNSIDVCADTQYFTIDDGQNDENECDDNIDNDNDGDTDYPDDAGCSSSSDDSEDSDDTNNGDDPVVTTLSADDVDENSATLQGELDDDGGENNLDAYFEWGTSSGNLNYTLTAGSVDDSGDEFSRTLSGLDENETYYFRACAENSNGDDCGSVKQFTTDEENVVVENNDLPIITTLAVIDRGSNYGSVDGFFDANGCSVATYFEYGTTQSLGRTTSSVTRGNGNGSMATFIAGLSANTTYYYRAVGTNCEGTSRGVIRSFTTTSGGSTQPPVISGGGNGNMIRLTITNDEDVVSSGDDLVYDVTWENISGRTLRDLLLEINLPEELEITDINDGDIDRRANSVIIEIPELLNREKGETSVEVTVRGGLRDGDPVVARAILAFENPVNQAQENAIAYDSDEFDSNGSVLGAFLFGAGFFPTTFGGWLLILLLIIVLVLLVRHYMKKDAGRTVSSTMTTTVTPADVPVAPVGGEYIPYRPTPKV